MPPDVYEQLLKIHRNQQLNVQQKSQQIDEIMRSLPQEVLDQLPLPPGEQNVPIFNTFQNFEGFDQLPQKYIKQARTIFGDKTLNFQANPNYMNLKRILVQEKDRKVFEFVRSLPPELRKLVRPPLPPAFERLNADVKN